MREIVFDTETTGLDCLAGDRLIEIGCVELLNHIPTGRTFHRYVNPRRPVAFEAAAVHGLTDEFLRSHPGFEQVVEEFVDFLGDSVLVAHNAGFDRGFINMEFGRCGRTPFEDHRFVDTLLLARRRHPNAPNSLDALCARYGIDTSARSRHHGALIDAKILAAVYLELMGGRQATLSLGALGRTGTIVATVAGPRTRPAPLPSRLADIDLAAHRAFVADLGGDPVWRRYLPTEPTPAM